VVLDVLKSLIMQVNAGEIGENERLLLRAVLRGVRLRTYALA
jgi:hypothetical protein